MNWIDIHRFAQAAAVDASLRAVADQAPLLGALDGGLMNSLGEENLNGFYNGDGEFERYMLAGDEAGVYVVKP